MIRPLLSLLALTAVVGNLFAEEAKAASKTSDPVNPITPPSESMALPALPERLTLQQAESYALAHQPMLAASQLRADAEVQTVYEARSQFFPQIQADSDTVKALHDDSRMAANAGISNPTILTRQSDGGLISQLITDFGRTYYLTTSARANALSAAERTEYQRQTLLYRVDQAYFTAQGAQALLEVANQTVSTNQVLLEQVKAMAKASLRSSLDVDFQQVSTSQAILLRLQAQARLQEAFAEFSAALGLGQEATFSLAPLQLEPLPPGEAGPLISEAWAHRPDLLSAREARDAALRFAKAETAAHYPVITAQGGAGISPGTANQDLPHDYGAVGLNVSVPVFTGGLITARAREAALRAAAAQRDLGDAETEAARDVYNAWIEARTSYDAIAVSDQLLQSAQEAFKLAQSRYKVGASSIVELSQANLQQIQAEITAATSRFDYQVRRRALDFQIGTLK